ncbi:hypothetical protein KO317_01950 [Candidatus Micrarchaeota archaeon]|jgi:hypothetical protein|nr:hypothetical protein [Candidatus Micrarchaeota archaeon]
MGDGGIRPTHLSKKKITSRRTERQSSFGKHSGIKGDSKYIENEKEYLLARYMLIDADNIYKLSRGIDLIEFLKKKYKSEALKYLKEVSNIYADKIAKEGTEKYQKQFEKLIFLANSLKSKEILNFLENVSDKYL